MCKVFRTVTPGEARAATSGSFINWMQQIGTGGLTVNVRASDRG